MWSYFNEESSTMMIVGFVIAVLVFLLAAALVMWSWNKIIDLVYPVNREINPDEYQKKRHMSYGTALLIVLTLAVLKSVGTNVVMVANNK